ncbi:Chondroitin synthase [Vibrio stylophorae]|uniref:Chondroitin synthase n=2 Tax=Vibrio stylophorae TaxID=659351 RepID=A0ABM8ZVX9_9VIBR|nr:glycosyltransferase family 2 protein [Vibrio stylophorae]CAH0534493.1 Chondroitin synthase [Vibrio stylophorae]
MDISVIMPTYNCLAWLPRALHSIRRQGAVREIMIVDDGSTDGSRQWLRQQSDVRLLETNRLGAGGARNYAIRNAKGKWIAFLDADDYWLGHKLARQYAQLEQSPSAVMNITDFRHMSNEGENLGRCFTPVVWPYFGRLWKKRHAAGMGVHEFQLFAALYQENFVGTSCVLVAKQSLENVGGFDTELSSASDWDLWLKVAMQGTIQVMPFVGMHYWVERPGSITRARQKRIDAISVILTRHGKAQPLTMFNRLRAYQRWYEGRAEQRREAKAIFTAILYELVAWLHWPQTRMLKRMLKDALPILNK